MSGPDNDLNRLFHDMANQSAAPEAASTRSLRRQHAIGGMRALARRLADERGRGRQRRRHWGWGMAAAALALCGSALAGAGGLLPFSIKGLTFRSRATVERHAQPATQAKPPVVAADAGAPTSPVASSEVSPSKEPSAPHVNVTNARQIKTETRDLEQVNQLFAAAKRARRERRDADALSLLQQLLAEHPTSVLAHEAAVERFRALARLGRQSEAQRYAGSYLSRYPSGFAAEEARRVVGGETP